ncbi:MAG: DNA topoisomerase 4 subunit A [Flexilinea sp.]|nr:DNA topoisomerase 4 subunit A [Flexilinea sp.]
MANTERGIRQVDIDKEMQQSYLDYAMSVIISRALPDARDGLKPVQRRILYAMYDMGIRPELPYKKSARIVGEVLGKYHPHGDAAVYDAMARLAQDFTIRYPLVDGQGNFGSVDGDPPAAMRYTEARLDKISMEILKDIDEETVGFVGNFDDTLKEPEVLPAIVPNLLVNGASGIAVGMATNIPPHNLGEICDAVIYMLQEWERYDEITVEDLMKYVKGPDFPTGGIVVLEDARNELVSAYATGRGRLMVRGRVHLEDMGRGRSRLIITEIPYQINKTGLIERIAQLVRDGVIEGIVDLRDESDRQGMRIVIELSKTGDSDSILRALYKHTPLQTTFGIILLALVDNKPRVLSLKEALKVYADHQLEVIRRKTEFELAKAKKRAHILEGLLTAIDNLEEIIHIIRSSENEAAARDAIMARFGLDREQTQAILDMPLKRLTHLEYDKLLAELEGLRRSIQEMEELLASPVKMRELLASKLRDLVLTYGDARRTQIALLGEGISSKEMLTANALIQAEDCFVGLTKDGKIGRVELETVKQRGFAIPEWIARSDTQQTVYVVSQTGKTCGIYVETLPKVEDFSAGIDFSAVSGWSGDEKPVTIFAMPSRDKMEESASVITVTEKGMMKRSLVGDVPFASSQSFTLCKINPGDRLLYVLVSPADTLDIMLVTGNGMGIRFGQDDLRPMGLIAAGVNGIKFKGDDVVVGASLVSESDSCCFVLNDWSLGQIAVSDFPKQGRYGQGVIALRLKENTRVVGFFTVDSANALLYVRYGNGRFRSLKISAAKSGRRARSLEPVTQNLLHEATGVTWLPMGKTQDEPAQVPTAKKNESKNAGKPLSEPPERNEGGSSPEQASLF